MCMLTRHRHILYINSILYSAHAETSGLRLQLVFTPMYVCFYT